MSRFQLNTLRAVLLMSIGSYWPYTWSQDKYPYQPINLIVGSPPGGASDTNARILAEPLSEALKQSVIIQNKPGLGGAVGTAQIAKARPDGYTIGVAISSVVVHPEAEKISGKKPLYELDQLEPIALISSDPMILVVRSDSPWKNLADLLKDAQKNPGKINYASTGVYGPVHLLAEMITHQTGAKFTQIPYSGGGPALMALLGASSDFTMISPGAALAQMASGKIRALSTSSNGRNPYFPDVPSYQESGVEASYTIWIGVYGPKDIAPSTLQVLRQGLRQATQSTTFLNAMQKQHIAMDYRDALEFKKFADEDGKRMVNLIRNIGKIEE